MKTALFVLLLLVPTLSFADERPLAVDLVQAINGVWISPQQTKIEGQPRYINFVVIPADFSPNGKLEIGFIRGCPQGTSFKIWSTTTHRPRSRP